MRTAVEAIFVGKPAKSDFDALGGGGGGTAGRIKREHRGWQGLV
jgi:hypothetical protein